MSDGKKSAPNASVTVEPIKHTVGGILAVTIPFEEYERLRVEEKRCDWCVGPARESGNAVLCRFCFNQIAAPSSGEEIKRLREAVTALIWTIERDSVWPDNQVYQKLISAAVAKGKAALGSSADGNEQKGNAT